MRLVPGNLIGNQRCAVTKRSEDRRGFIHTNTVLEGADQEVFISAAAAEELGKAVGMVPEAEVDALRERIAGWEAKYEDIKTRVDAIDRIEELQRVVTA